MNSAAITPEDPATHSKNRLLVHSITPGKDWRSIAVDLVATSTEDNQRPIKDTPLFLSDTSQWHAHIQGAESPWAPIRIRLRGLPANPGRLNAIDGNIHWEAHGIPQTDAFAIMGESPDTPTLAWEELDVDEHATIELPATDEAHAAVIQINPHDLSITNAQLIQYERRASAQGDTCELELVIQRLAK